MRQSHTVIVQIGNSDDKLAQSAWCQFVKSCRSLVSNYGTLHFSGHSFPTDPRQNACFVIESKSMDDMEARLRDLAFRFKQESIALTIGTTTFIESENKGG